MSVEVKFTPHFARQFKRLSKKYASLPDDLEVLVEELKENPQKGQALGNKIYKIRLAITSKGQGKSGGARVITFLVLKEKSEKEKTRDDLYLLLIYDKGETSNITKEQIINLLDRIGL